MTTASMLPALAVLDQEVSDLKRAQLDLQERVAALEAKVQTEQAHVLEELDDRLDAHDVRLDDLHATLATESRTNRDLLLELRKQNTQILAILLTEVDRD